MLAVAAVVLFVFIWFCCRIEPPSGRSAVLVRLDAEDLPAHAIIATEPGPKGIQLEPVR